MTQAMHSIQAPIRWGIIGCGNVTERKSGPAYNKTPGFVLHGVMRRDAAKAQDYAKRHAVPKFYSDADALINDPEIDAVYIATPPDSHADYAIRVAAAGKICCIEKPMASNYPQCLKIEQAFKERNIPLFVTYYRRSLPRFLQVKKWLDEGRIGAVRQVHWHLMKQAVEIDLSGQYNWRTDPKIAVGGHFDDLASHGIDLLIFLLGNIEQATGVSCNQQQLYGARDAVAGCWRHESGVIGSGSWNFACSDNEDRVEIVGSEGKIEFAIFDSMPLVLQRGALREEQVIEHPDHIQLHHVANMRRHLSGEISHPSNGATACHTAWVMDKILGQI